MISEEHEQVVFGRDPVTGLRAMVAIHSTALGPSLGGCRMRPYADEQAMVDDALLLSKAMSYKNALAGLDLGELGLPVREALCGISDPVPRLEGAARRWL